MVYCGLYSYEQQLCIITLFPNFFWYCFCMLSEMLLIKIIVVINRCRAGSRSVAQMVLPLVTQWLKTTGHVFMMFTSPCSSQKMELLKGQVMFFRPIGGMWHLGLSLLGHTFSVRYPWMESFSMTSSLRWSVPLKSTSSMSFFLLVMELPVT